MTWPLSQDYNEAIQNPRSCFIDEDLRQGEVTLNALGLPVPRSGNFADVYQVRTPDGRKWAVKCFTRQVTGLHERYAAIDVHLQKASLPFNVGFRFFTEGIRIRGEAYPLLKMEWVEGFTLNEFVRANLDKKPNLEALCQIWLRLSRRLREARIAHADLQHGNVLLVPGARASTLGLKLIDYDGMWVPDLASKPSGELGHPAFQHPQRLRDRIYSRELDRFPHLVIGTALLSLIVGGPRLWDKYDNGDNLLFREVDLQAPEQSTLVRELWGLGSPTLCHLLGQLALACWRPLNQSPWLDELMASPQALALKSSQEVEICDRLQVTMPGRETVAVAAALPEATPNVFAELTSETSPGTERSPAWLFWLVSAGIAAAVLAVVAGGGFLVLSANFGGKPSTTSTMAAREDEGGSERVVGDPKVADQKRPELIPLPRRLVCELIAAPHRFGVEKLAQAWSISGRANPRCLEFTPDGLRFVLSTGTNGDGAELIVFETKTGNLIVRHSVGAKKLEALVMCPDASVLTVNRENLTNRWNLESGRLLRTFQTEAGLPRIPAVPPTGAAVLVPGRERWLVHVYDLDKGIPERNYLSGSVHPVVNVRYAPDGKKWIAVDDARGVNVADVDSNVATQLIDPLHVVRNVALSPEGRLALGFGPIPKLVVWEVATGKATLLEGHTAAVTDAVFSDDGKLVLSVGGDKTLRQWDAKTGQELQKIELPEVASCVRAAPDGEHVLTASLGGDKAALQLWKFQREPEQIVAPSSMPSPLSRLEGPAGEVFRYEGSPGAVSSVALLPDGKRCLTVGNDDMEMRLWNLDTGEVLKVYRGHTDKVSSLAVSADGSRAVTASHDGSLIVWDVASGAQLHKLVSVRAPVHVCVISPDGKRVLSLGPAHGLREWDLQTGKLVRSYSLSYGVSLALSPDGKMVLVGTNRGTAVLFDLTLSRQRQLLTATGIRGSVRATAFAPDGRLLVTGSDDGAIRVWTTLTGKQERALAGHPGPVTALAMHHDGKQLLSGGQDGSFRQWDLGTGNTLHRAKLSGAINALVILPDGRRALIGDADKMLRLWRLEKREP